MSAYLIVEFTVKDPETYKREVRPLCWADSQRARRRTTSWRQLGSPARRWLAHVRGTHAVCRP